MPETLQQKMTRIVETLAMGSNIQFKFFSQMGYDEELKALATQYLSLADMHSSGGSAFPASELLNINNEQEFLVQFRRKAAQAKDYWSGGMCFGFSAMYLLANTPKGREMFPTTEDLFAAFDMGLSLGGEGHVAPARGMLTMLATLHLRQKGKLPLIRVEGGDIERGRNNYEVGFGFDADRAGRMLFALRGQVNRINDQQTANNNILSHYGFVADPTGDNYKEYVLTRRDQGTNKKSNFSEDSVQPMVKFIGPAGKLSMIWYGEPFSGGHQMAGVGMSSGCKFFDPNLGEIIAPSNSAMVAFLKRWLSYVYSWGGVEDADGKATRNASTFMKEKWRAQSEFPQASKRFRVQRYHVNA